MPTFDFTCSACKAEFEFSRPFGSEQKPRCPACGSAKTEKQITPPTIHFKGAGFFVTDSRKQAEKKLEKKEEKPKEAKTEKKEASTEGKKTEKKTQE